MNAITGLTGRLLAYAAGQAVPIRQTSTIIRDPMPSFAIAPIRMVAEQVVYALAYGDPDATPDIVLSWNPLDRDAQFLIPFAAALDRYLNECVSLEQMPRIWLPHGPALEVIELLGHRYRTNQSVGPELQRMGAQCRLLAEETIFAGQQIVAIAGSVLAAHVATGQSPSEDLHLGALLAWIEPSDDMPAAEAAAQAALAPAAAMLARTADDRVEKLRERVVQRRMPEQQARHEAEQIIREQALREWTLVTRARKAFWGLNLTQGAELNRLAAESLSRVAWQIDHSYSAPTRPRSLAQRLDALVYAQELVEYAAVVDDPIARAAALNAGRVIETIVVGCNQPRPGFAPCLLELETRQDVLRIRRGAMLQARGARVFGRVIDIRETENGQATQLRLDITRGVRNSALPAVGQRVDWMTPEPTDLRHQKRRIYERMAAANDPRVFGDQLPASQPDPSSDDLATIARRLRQ